MPAAKQTAKRRARARRSWPALPALPRFALEPHELDLFGLALVALGLFLSFVVYFDRAGGEIGEGVAGGMRVLIGTLAYGVPAGLVCAGALIVARTVLPAWRPLRTGAACIVLALLLALAAGTFGLGPAHPRHGFFRPLDYEPRGGLAGDTLYWLTSHAFSDVGSNILAVFGFLAGVILITGASLATIARVAHSSVLDTGRRVRQGATVASQAVSRRAPAPLLLPPEHDSDELTIRIGSGAAAPPPEDPEDYGEPYDVDADAVAVTQEIEGGHDEEPEDQAADPAQEPTVLIEGAALTPQGRYRASVTEDPEFPWKLPNPRFLRRSSREQARPDTAGQAQVAQALLEALGHFGVEAKVTGTVTGPHITRYELRLAPGIKMSKVAALKEDLAYALAATDVRILAPIPGKQAVGVEVPNRVRKIVHLGDVLAGVPAGASPLTVWLGKDVSGKAIYADLARMPHLLVAGTTGAGKSACVNAMLSSILLGATPHDVRMVLVDPKQVELNHYESIPHLLTPVITSPRMAANALQNLVKEMELRYGLMSLARTRSLIELNRARAERGEPALPYILCVIDELADLMMVAPADVEESIVRLAQKARAVGIHLVLATQSPRVNVITGLIKANVPSRIAFAVSSQTDSRVILDENGAEGLLGQGDMLFAPVGTSRVQRIQGAYVDEGEIAHLTEAWKRQGAPEFREELLEEVASEEEEPASEDEAFSPDEDPLLEQAIALVAQMQTASTSMLQRRLRLGYTRAGRLIDMLERRSIISGYEGSKPRQVLVSEADVPRILAGLAEAQRATVPADDGA